MNAPTLTAAEFRHRARPVFGTVSGPDHDMRVAVRNVTGYRQLAEYVTSHGGTVSETTRRYPELVHVSFTVTE